MSEITTVRKEEPSATVNAVTNGNSDSTEILWIFQRRVFWFAHWFFCSHVLKSLQQWEVYNKLQWENASVIKSEEKNAAEYAAEEEN